jgi:hypothetical protein
VTLEGNTRARTAADPIAVSQHSLTTVGACLMPAAYLSRGVGANAGDWARFSSHWEDLAPDSYAAELGTQRLRRYGHFVFRASDGTATLLPHRAFVQPQDSNPLYVGRDRHFEPLTDSFARDPLLHKVLELLGRVATALDDLAEWSAKVTPFRVIASNDGAGQPTPEGLHRDGVTLVSSLLVGRRNAVGGASAVHDLDGRRLLATTLCEPGSLLLGDDRRTLHSVSPIRPASADAPAQRDVLVVTFAPSTPPDHPPPR